MPKKSNSPTEAVALLVNSLVIFFRGRILRVLKFFKVSKQSVVLLFGEKLPCST